MSKRSTKRRAQWGSISRVRADTWRIRYWGQDASGEYKRRSCTVRGTRMDAERRRAELMLAHSEDAPCPTVGEVWRSYVMHDMECRVNDGDMSQSTSQQYRSWWANYVEGTWGSVPCDHVLPLAIQQWLYGLTRSQAQCATVVLSKAMDYAVRYGWCQTNPMRERYVMPGRSTVSGHDKGIWTLPELGELWGRVYGTWMEPAFILSAFGSARVGESMGVLAGEVSLRDVGGVPVAVVPIVRQVSHDGARVDDHTKTAESVRSVVIVGRAATRLAEIAASMPADWHLTNDGTGAPVSQGRYTRRWKAIGMEHPFRNLRNSWQTWMRWDLRVEPYFIEVLMGHKVQGTTGKYYDRPQADVLAGVVADAYRARQFDRDWQVG